MPQAQAPTAEDITRAGLEHRLAALNGHAKELRNPVCPAAADLHDQINRLLDELVGR